MEDAFRHCERLVHEADKDRFFASLFAPAARRDALFALYAFNAEIARVRERAREPLPGEIRLLWWSEVLAGERAGEARAHPVAAALRETIDRYALPVALLDDLVTARGFDLYDRPMADLASLEDYLRKTSSALMSVAARILAGGAAGAEVDAVTRHAGVAYGIAGVLGALPLHTARRQLYLPLDLLRRHGADAEALFALRPGAALGRALAELRTVARAHLDAARRLVAATPAAAGPALLPAALVEPEIRRMERAADPLRVSPLPSWRRQWILWRAARGQRVRF